MKPNKAKKKKKKCGGTEKFLSVKPPLIVLFTRATIFNIKVSHISLKQVKSNKVQNKSVQYFPLTHDSNPLSAHYRECSDNLKTPRPQGLNLYVTSPGLFFFYSHLYCVSIGQLGQKSSSFIRPHSWIGPKAVTQ